ncbi:MAG: response regulator [Bacteroidetes bacterium]|nr:response regulator [Bacteroidota bacterium]
MKILIVEDEKALPGNVLSYCNRGDIVCEAASGFREAEDKLAAFPYDILVLDIMLPDGSGLDLLHQLKKTQPEAGALIISAKNALDDRITGLELGADDYLTRPFHLPELNARLKAIYRHRKFQGRGFLGSTALGRGLQTIKKISSKIKSAAKQLALSTNPMGKAGLCRGKIFHFKSSVS